MTATRTSDDDRASPAAGADTADFLFHVLAADRRSSDPSRHSLAGVDEVRVVRGEPQGWRRDGRRLTLAVDDRWMSNPHARLQRREQRWWLLCEGAKNGSYRNTRRITETVLADGDVLELGHSFFVFRAGQPSPRGAPLDVSAAALHARPAALRSLSPSLSLLFEGVAAVAPSGLPLVIAGETGTGKELLARAVHDLGGRRGPLVAVNCGALPPTLAESELLGFRRGTFSGATEDRPGLVRAADHGTLFLDEVVELPPAAQTALLRVLQEREVLALGATRPVAVDFRLIVASHGELDDAVAAGRFREDLRARLHGFTARLPPLRARREDLGLLVAGFARAAGRAEPVLSRAAARELLTRPWPRNIRELERCLHVATTLAGDGVIQVHHLDGELAPERAPPVAAPAPALSAEAAARRDRLEQLLREHQGNVTHVAQALRTPRVQVYRWLKRYGLDALTFR